MESKIELVKTLNRFVNSDGEQYFSRDWLMEKLHLSDDTLITRRYKLDKILKNMSNNKK